jgi:hypothetical protein
MYLGPVSHPFCSGYARAVSAAVEVPVRLDAVTNHLHPAVLADRGEGVDGTLEAIEGVPAVTSHPNLEGFVVVVAADLALCHAHHPLRVPFPASLTTPTPFRTNAEV